MLGKVSKARHAIVGLAVAGTSALAGFGVIGAGSHDERVDAKTIVAEPAPTTRSGSPSTSTKISDTMPVMATST